jgi:hypothetical protein
MIIEVQMFKRMLNKKAAGESCLFFNSKLFILNQYQNLPTAQTHSGAHQYLL